MCSQSLLTFKRRCIPPGGVRTPHNTTLTSSSPMVFPMTLPRLGILTLASFTLAACGGEAENTEPPVVEEPIAQVERVPLTEDDLFGLEMSDLDVEIPWTTNVVSRQANPVAPRSMIEAVELSSHEGFDRAQFTFSSDAPAAGYDIRLVDSGSAVTCGSSGSAEDSTVAVAEQIPDLEGTRLLVVLFKPARVEERGRTTLPIGTEMYDHERIQEAGVTCTVDQTVTWVAGLVAGDELRVLQMRSPQRLVIDVR